MINSLRYLCCCVRYSERDLSRARLYSVCDVISDSKSSTEEVIYTSQEMKSVTAEVAIKDIMARDNDNKETSVIIENSNDGKMLSVTSKRLLQFYWEIIMFDIHTTSQTSSVQQMQE